MTEKFQSRLEEAARRKYLADKYGAVIEAAGYFDGDFEIDPEDAVILGGRIQNDRVVAALVRKPEFHSVDHDYPAVVLPHFVAALESLTDDDRAELRARINHKPLTYARRPS
jgi:hypothetical protein